MMKLSDTQRVLLLTASQRENGSILPLPVSLKPGGGVSKAIATLISRGLAEERETNNPGETRRTEGDVRSGVFVTIVGLTAVGVEPAQGAAAGTEALPVPAATPRTSKTNLVVDLLSRPDGATLAELIEVTGWLPHTTRAALTGLRKKGHAVERSKRGEATCYSIKASA